MDVRNVDGEDVRHTQRDLSDAHAECMEAQVVRPKEKRAIKLTAKAFSDKA